MGTRHSGPEYSSDAIHIHFAIHICRTHEKNSQVEETELENE